MAAITGQKPVITKAKKSIAAFKLRTGMPIGGRSPCAATRMYEFLDRLINVALPRVRDFRGRAPKSFDGRGNYTLGLREQLIFPEIEYDKIDKVRGMDITFVTTARDGRGGSAACCTARHAVPRVGRGERAMAKTSADQQAAEHSEVQGARLHAVRTVRAPARISPQVPAVPNLLPEPGPEG